ncbi:AraC family transcriptional regulator [Streptomyces kaniharaensis]|uniref:AraC family transcriptional regulator n=1 Tax=Streptomyces kaniharaensis TaxID=212423 RepID=A0A6N7KUN1_9ACTN|nr:AraC family transcriptional regulator [Streptomyces kaniharaensis]MQS15220.1 AraC family transcriptional regulator [Streptomyces kaniharaensis]
MLEHLNRAMEHIERNLDHEVEVAELARIAMTSEYHFRRLFSMLAGIPLSEYVRRRRLTVAGAEVLGGERTLLDVAVRYGYTSGEAFARAFRAMHGVGPGEARRDGAVLKSQPRMSFRLVVEGTSTMEYRIVQKPALRIVGKRARVTLIYEGVNPAIAEFIKGLGTETVARISALSDQDPDGIISVTDCLSENREEGSDVDYWHAVVARPDAELPDDLDVLDVPAGTWAVFSSTGPFPQALQRMWGDTASQWFPSNPYEARPGPELLRTRFVPGTGDAEAQLWIPVTRVARS